MSTRLNFDDDDDDYLFWETCGGNWYSISIEVLFTTNYIVIPNLFELSV